MTESEDVNIDSHIFCIFNFNKTDIKLIASMPEGRWRKILDSSDKVWNGPGTLLPERISSGEKMTIRGHSFTGYIKEEIS